MENLADRMKRDLPAAVFDFLRQAGDLAKSAGLNLFLVGGSVRDLLLERRVLDLDLVTEGDASVLAHELAKHLEGTVTAYSPFGTAKVRLKDLTVDLATARHESYSRPGALPQVRPGSIEDDLKRRDFTINAMAVALDNNQFGRLLDPYEGRQDLTGGAIRVLHNQSFVDDATRMIRAVRYEQRLGFRLEEHTEALLRHNLSMLDTISGDRIRGELRRLLDEDKPVQALTRLHELGIAAAIYPPLDKHRTVVARLGNLEVAAGRNTPVYMAALAYPLHPEEVDGLVKRLNLPKRWAKTVRDVAQITAMSDTLSESLPPSQLFAHLNSLALEAVQAISTLHPDRMVRDNLLSYLTHVRHTRTILTGRDLLALGVTPGPLVGKALDSLLVARLDGKVSTRAEEERWVREFLAKQEKRNIPV